MGQRMLEPVVIDGSAGGGQMLRNAVALSAVTGRPLRVENVRGARPRPGLRPQHVSAVQALARACGAEVVGAEIGSRELEFRPGRVEAQSACGTDVGTAGSLTLVLQCLLPPLARTSGESTLTLIGGTDVPFAPPLDYFAEVFAPALAELGPRVEVELDARGFYPAGGGRIRVRLAPPAAIRGVRWSDRGPLRWVRGRAFSAGLPGHIVERMRAAALDTLGAEHIRDAEIELEAGPRGGGEGCGITLWAECEGGRRFGGSALSRPGKPAERVGQEAARALVKELRAPGALDSHLADQMVVWLAVAEGPSEFTTGEASEHLRSAVEVARAVAGATFVIEGERPARVVCEPRG